MIWEEQNLQFEFGEQWHVLKLDEHYDYRERIARLGGTKSVDFLGVFNEHTVYFIEVKDFHGYRIENKDRLQDGLLADEVGQKVRDSLACVISAHRNSAQQEVWKKFIDLLCNRQKDIKVIIWLEQELPIHPIQQRKALASISVTKFKAKLAWLTRYVMVSNIANNILPDVKVVNLPRTSA